MNSATTTTPHLTNTLSPGWEEGATASQPRLLQQSSSPFGGAQSFSTTDHASDRGTRPKMNSATTTTPHLTNTLSPGWEEGATASQPRLLQQPSSPFGGAQSFSTTETEEEEDVNLGYRIKVKMFQMAPSDDPQLEERRQRALYAKKNRDMKREAMQLQYEKEAFRTRMEQCQAELTRVYELSQDQQRKIEELERRLMDTHHQLRVEKDNSRKMQQQMSLLKAHLELIAEGLEENNIYRKMLVTLLAQMK